MRNGDAFDDGIGISSDWGDTWTVRKAPAVITRGIGFVGPQERLLARSDKGTYASDDGGATWTTDLGWNCAQPPKSSLDGHVLACNDSTNDLLVSLDAGQTWAVRGSGVGLMALSPNGSTAVGVNGDTTVFVADLGQ